MERNNELAGSFENIERRWTSQSLKTPKPTYLEDKLVLNPSSELGLTNCDSLVGRTLGTSSIIQLSPGVFSIHSVKNRAAAPASCRKVTPKSSAPSWHHAERTTALRTDKACKDTVQNPWHLTRTSSFILMRSCDFEDLNPQDQPADEFSVLIVEINPTLSFRQNL